jgi:hypothetical protein
LCTLPLFSAAGHVSSSHGTVGAQIISVASDAKNNKFSSIYVAPDNLYGVKLLSHVHSASCPLIAQTEFPVEHVTELQGSILWHSLFACSSLFATSS